MKNILTKLQALQESAQTQSGISFHSDVNDFIKFDLPESVDELQQDQITMDKLEIENKRLRRQLELVQKIRAVKRKVTA